MFVFDWVRKSDGQTHKNFGYKFRDIDFLMSKK